MGRNFSSTAAKMLVLVLALASFAWVWWIITTERDRIAATTVELAIVRGGIDPERAIIAKSMLRAHAGDCRTDFRRPAMAIAIFEAERPNAPPEAGAAALEAIGDHLRCSPMQANAWFLLAVFEARNGVSSDIAMRHMALSYRFGPREAWIAARRVVFLCAQTDGIPVALRVDALADFGGLLEAQRVPAAVDAYRRCGREDRAGLDQVIAAASPEARAAFAHTIAMGGVLGTRP